jgi:hypothetical protein
MLGVMKMRIGVLDYMGTMAEDLKEELWISIMEIINKNDPEKVLKNSGMSIEMKDSFLEYINQENPKPMKFRDFAFENGFKEVAGKYFSVGAEAGKLNILNITNDTEDFLVESVIQNIPIYVFSTLGAPPDYRNMQEILLEKHELSDYNIGRLDNANIACKNALGLLENIVISKLKKTEPGKALSQEFSNGMLFYVDDELGVIKDVYSKSNSKLKNLFCMDINKKIKEFKEMGIEIQEDKPNIIVVNDFYDVVNALYK